MKKKVAFSVFALCMLFSLSQAGALPAPPDGYKGPLAASSIGDSLHALHYDISIEVTSYAAHTIAGYTKIFLASRVDNLQAIRLELMNLTVDSLFVDGVQNTTFTHANQVIGIPLSASLNTGDQVEVEVYYQGVPFHEDWGGFHFAGEYAFNLGVGFVSDPHNLGKAWFPCIDDFTDRATYDVYGTAEYGKMAVCGGLLTEVVDNGDSTKTYHWKLDREIPTYLASVAFGNYVAVTDTFHGINADVPIGIYVRPQDSVKVFGTFIHLKDILAVYEDRFGPYPFERVGYVGTAIGAMEHACNIAYPNFLIDGTTSGENTMAHELSHMWFGDATTCATAEDMWLNEGWAVFCEYIMMEGIYGPDSYKEYLNDKHAEILQYAHTNTGPAGYLALNQIPTSMTYDGMNVYDRGSTVAYSLRGYLGDSLFFKAAKAYLEEYNMKSVSSYDMCSIMSQHTGVNLNDFFETWVYTPGTPHYSVDSFDVSPNALGYLVTVYMKQKRKGNPYLGNNAVVELTFMNNNWETYKDTIHFSGPSGHSTIQVPFASSVVMCDRDEKLCDATTHAARVVKTTGDVTFPKTHFQFEVQQVSDSAYVRVEHNWAPPDTLKADIPGLRISNYRYWKIDGIFPPGFVATGRFFCTKNSYLDDGLILNETDSSIVMYREDPGKDWRFIDITKVGLWHTSFIYVDSLKKGEYVVAVCDTTFVNSIAKKKFSKPLVKIFPNPSKDAFNFSLLDNRIEQIRICDIQARAVDTIRVEKGVTQVRWKPANLNSGTYFLRMMDRQGRTLGSEKIIYNGNP